MTPAANTLLSLIVVSLGFIAIILSFLVPDRKKSFISLLLAGIIVLAGLIQFGSQSLSAYRWNKRMKDIEHDRRVDLEELRQKLKEKAAEMGTPLPAGQDATKKQ